MADSNDIRGDDLVLEVNGNAFTGWESMTIGRSIEAASGSFTFQSSSRLPWPIRPGDEVVVRLGTEALLTGYVDDLGAEGDKSETRYRVAGRDRTADLVDCSEITDPGEWIGLTLIELVRAIALPFGVRVRAEANPDEVFALFTRQSGETAWSAIERACRLRGVLAYSTGDGELAIARPASGNAQTELATGRDGNVESWSVRVSNRERFSSYVIRGQRPGDDDAYGDAVIGIEGSARDDAIGRFRPLLVLAEGSLTFESATDRAGYEATFRAARAAEVRVKVAGWRQVPVTGRPWRVNDLVSVRIPEAQAEQSLLVKEVRFARDKQSGSETTLTLTRRDAYIPQPIVDTDAEALAELLGTDEDEGDF